MTMVQVYVKQILAFFNKLAELYWYDSLGFVWMLVFQKDFFGISAMKLDLNHSKSLVVF